MVTTSTKKVPYRLQFITRVDSRAFDGDMHRIPADPRTEFITCVINASVRAIVAKSTSKTCPCRLFVSSPMSCGLKR